MRIILNFIFVIIFSGVAYAGYDENLICSDPPDFAADNGNNRSFAEAWQYVRNSWDSWTSCSKGPIRYHKNVAGDAYEFWYCVTSGQWCEYSSPGPRPRTKTLINCGSGLRNYTGQSFVGNLSQYSGVASDANSLGLSYDMQECESVMVQFVQCPEGSVAWYVDMTDNSMYYVETGVTDCVPFPEQWLSGTEYDQNTTPTPTSIPPTSTPPISTPTPTPTPPISSPTPPVATPTPETYPHYTPAPPVVYSTPSYSATVVPTPGESGTVLDSNIDDIEYNSQVPDVGQDLTEDDSWLDTIFDLFSNHPLVDVIKGSKITTSGELCSLSINLYGSVIEISFCNLVDYVEIFGYFITVCASIYAYFIIFKG